MEYFSEDYYDQFENEARQQHPSWRKNEIDLGCGFCYDARSKRNIELYFLDRANNMRPCDYCPSCGRKLL